MAELTINDGNIPARLTGGTLKSATPAEINTLLGTTGAIANVVEDITPQLGAALDGQGFDLNNLGVAFFTEQAAAEADVAGKGQLWVKTATPNELWFTDDAGTDFQLGTLAGTETLTNKSIDSDNNTITNIANADIKAAAAIAVNKLAALTASEIVIGDGSGFLTSAAVATYPSLTELAYVKGVTSAVQTQMDTKLANLSEDTTPQAGGELDLQANSIGGTVQTATGDGTTTIDWGLGNMFDFQFGAFNETFTFTAPTKPGTFILKLVQDSVGSRTATWPATVKWPSGTAPTLTTTATTGTDICTFYWNGTSYFAVSTLDLS